MKRGGRERQLATIVKYSDLDNRVVYFNEFERNSYIEEYNLLNKVHRIKTKPSKRFQALSRYCIDNKPDVIISWGNYEAIMGLIVSFVIKAKFINASIRHGIRDKKLSHYLRTLVLHLSPYIIANSSAGLKANNLSMRNSRYVLYNGKEIYYKKKIGKAEKLTRLYELFPKIKDDEIIFISVANLVPFKDYKTVFKALLKIKDQIAFRYLIIGNGPMKEELVNLSNKLDIDDRLYFAGSVENVLFYLQMADIMIHSSKGEGISNAILEGMFAGLPIIATNVGGIPETVFDKTSSLFQYKNIDELASILMNTDQIINDCNKYSRELEDFLKRFSLETMILEYERIIKKIIRNN